MSRLIVCRASAGTGKTRSICDLIVERIVERNLDPARILATTFTLKAAAELKRRIQSRLLTEPTLTADRRLELADRLELANIGTVDAIAYQILERYAFDLGLSPQIRVSDEAATDQTLRAMVAQIDPEPWAALHRAAHPLEIEDLTRVVRTILEIQRANAITDDALREQLSQSAERMIEVLAPGSGAPGSTGGAMTGVSGRPQLATLAGQIHDAMLDVEDKTKVTKNALDTLRRWSAGKDHTWHDLIRAAKLTAGKRSGADALLAPLRAVVGETRRHPQLHDDIRAFMQSVADVTIDIAERYRHYKSERGLLDFRDLEVEVLRLLSDERTAAQLAGEIDLLVVDEFQDTDPLQLAIFLELRERVSESYWVGDEKQAIYGFRGTDARLTREIWDCASVDEQRRLDTCYRSRARLVEFTRDLFAERLGDSVDVHCGRDDTPRTDNAEITTLSDRHEIERWVIEAWRRDEEAEATANGVCELIAERVPRGDIAVLVRTNREATAIGQALEDRGVPCVTELPGVIRTREALLAISGLRLLADRWDSLAAANLLHHLPNADSPHANDTPAWLESRLSELTAEKTPAPFTGDATIEAIDAIRARARVAKPREALASVIEALNLAQRVVGCGDPARRLGNLDALLNLASAYEELRRAAARPATVTGLLSYFEQLRENGEDRSVPQSGLDSVTLVTYHAAKGLEWPVVVLSSLGYDSPPDLWRPEAIGAVDIRGGNPLSERRIRYWPWPFGRSSSGWGRRSSGDGFESDALATEEGLAADREQEAELVRLLYVGITRARDRVVLAYREDRMAWLSHIHAAKELLSSRAIDRVRTLRPGNSSSNELEPFTWLEPPHADSTRPRIAAESSPSDMSPTADSQQSWPLTPVRIAPIDVADDRLQPDEPRDRIGEAWHAYLASLPSTRALADDARLAIARRCFAAFAGDVDVDPSFYEQVVASGERLHSWIVQRFGTASWYAETPLTAPRRDGGRWVGIADLVLVVENGDHILIDHKSTAVNEAGWPAVAERYARQLDNYTEILEQQGVTVRERWIHLPRSGGLVEVGRAMTRPVTKRAPDPADDAPWVQPELF